MSDFEFRELAIRYETLKELFTLALEIIPESENKNELVSAYKKVAGEENGI